MEVGTLLLGQKVKDFFETEPEEYNGVKYAMAVLELENGTCIKFPLVENLTAFAVPDFDKAATSVIVN